MTETATAPKPAKADPETLALRASPERVTRFRRGAIVAIAAGGSLAIVGVAWLALKPATLDLVGSEGERSVAASRSPADALAGAPATYDEVPQLGPPLPGDLGKPILDRQRDMAMAAPADPVADAAARAAEEAEAERQRIAAEQRAARESDVMLQLAGGSRAVSPAPVGRSRPTGSADASAAGADADHSDQRGGTALDGPRNRDDAIGSSALDRPSSPWTLQAGSVIAASLITGLNSDLPGFVTAQVTENVYDSATGRSVLIPQGSRLLGRYDSKVAFGQRRLLLVWERLVLPDGSSIDLDNAPATDAAGFAGLSDRVDVHTWQQLKGIVLSTLLGVGTELTFGDGESELARALRESTQQAGAKAGDRLIMRILDVQPTLKVRPGWPLRVVVHKDIQLRPWGDSRD